MKLDNSQRYTPPPHTKKWFIGLQSRASLSISALNGRRGRDSHAYGICAPFYCISQKNYGGGGGYNAASGLISMDIASYSYVSQKEHILLIIKVLKFQK